MCFEPFVSFAPGRVCVFGEHQDYLGLPVIAAAVPLGCTLVVQPRADGWWHVRTPALEFSWSCHVHEAVGGAKKGHPGPASFLRAGLAEVLEEGWNVGCGGDVICHVDLPVQAGLSSSSALVVAWVQALARASHVDLSPLVLARFAHRVEVTHFGAPGGHMDHVASALGGIHRIHPSWHVEALKEPGDGVWVVVDTGEPKDTHGQLTRCKDQRLALVSAHGGAWKSPAEVEGWEGMDAVDRALWQTTWNNLHLERRAAEAWPALPDVACWMGEHHRELRDGLGLSTSNLEAVGSAAMGAGAWGWKVVGSGGGGCALVWAPRDANGAVHAAVRNAGARASWSLGVAQGAHVRTWKPPHHPMVILAAGRSSRMKSREAAQRAGLPPERCQLLQDVPKAMLPVDAKGKPFLALILERAASEGVDEVCVVFSAEDDRSEGALRPWVPEGLRWTVARQTVPAYGTKPEGTAAAVAAALVAHPEWEGISVSVCNGDNLPPAGCFERLSSVDAALLVFNRDAFGLPCERVQAFAVAEWGADEGLLALWEKPTAERVAAVADAEGRVWVGMNVFRLPHGSLRDACLAVAPHPERGERELPTALLAWRTREARTLPCIPMNGAFLDLTHPHDWANLNVF